MTDWLVTVPLGAVLGFLIGLTGVGDGALVAPSLYVILGLNYQDSIVIALMMVVPAGLTHFGLGGVSVRLLALLMVGSLLGTVLGAKTALRLPEWVTFRGR